MGLRKRVVRVPVRLSCRVAHRDLLLDTRDLTGQFSCREVPRIRLSENSNHMTSALSSQDVVNRGQQRFGGLWFRHLRSVCPVTAKCLVLLGSRSGFRFIHIPIVCSNKNLCLIANSKNSKVNSTHSLDTANKILLQTCDHV